MCILSCSLSPLQILCTNGCDQSTHEDQSDSKMCPDISKDLNHFTEYQHYRCAVDLISYVQECGRDSFWFGVCIFGANFVANRKVAGNEETGTEEFSFFTLTDMYRYCTLNYFKIIESFEATFISKLKYKKLRDDTFILLYSLGFQYGNWKYHLWEVENDSLSK